MYYYLISRKVDIICFLWQLLWELDKFALNTCGNLTGLVAIPVAIWRAHWQRYKGSQAPLVLPVPSQKPTPETRNHTLIIGESHSISPPPFQTRCANFSSAQLSLTVCRVMKALSKLIQAPQWPDNDSEAFFVAVSHPAGASNSCFKPVFSSGSTFGGLVLYCQMYFSDSIKNCFSLQ